ncbi:MAG: tRNA (guanosine(37)-N1)-methyltransferase TrmD [Alphaproteobacteria bacterium]|nr:tRNA (guanosine(37)-N1)-methyltransferase TrmD [Alphaproteobacteria bacterium]
MTQNTCWQTNILTLFPEVFSALDCSICKRAIEKDIVRLNIVNIRDFATDNYKTVDDAPYGGGAGQVIKPDVLGRAIESVYNKDNPKGSIIYLSPRGKVFNQQMAETLSCESETTFICGHYEGIDERVIEYYNIQEISIGDFVLSGGEYALLPIIDSITRLLPNVLGSSISLEEESFSPALNGLLEYPHYTRPEVWNGMPVPEVLKSGHHKNINEWRYQKSLEITKKNRPDLLTKDIEF